MTKRLRTEPDVRLLVGPDKTEVMAFSQILALTSDFFDAALSSQMREAQTRCFELPDQDPEAIRELLDYINPGSDTALTKENVLKLLPMLHQFQFRMALETADKFCANSERWGCGPSHIGSHPRMLQVAVDFALPATRGAAMKVIVANLPRDMLALEPLATDSRYADVMKELTKREKEESLRLAAKARALAA